MTSVESPQQAATAEGQTSKSARQISAPGRANSLLLVTGIDVPHSIHQRTHNVIRELSNVFDLTSMYFSDRQPPASQDARVLRLPRKRGFAVRTLQVFRLLRATDAKFDIVLGEGPWAGLVAVQIKGLGRAKRFVYEDLDYFPADSESFPGWLLRSILERLCVISADGLICVGNRLRALRTRQGGKRVTTIPNGADRRKFGLPRVEHTIPTLVYSGSLAEWCGLEMVLGSIPELRRRLPGLKVLIAGDGGIRQRLEDLVARLGIGGAVRFLGRIPYDELPALLGSADIGLAMLAPTDLTRYAFPLKLAEYLAAGLPVVATDDTETADFVGQHGAGLVAKFEISSFVEAVEVLFRDHHLYERCADAALHAASLLDWGRLMEREARFIRALGSGSEWLEQ